MRVSRRTRPSQVGFAASIGRRRLLQTFDALPAETRSDPLSTDGLRLVIRLDFSPTDSAIVAEAERQDAEATRFQPAVAVSSSARGR
jgi:hypothetical protein